MMSVLQIFTIMMAKLISNIENWFEQLTILKKEALAINIENYENNHLQKENTKKCKYWNQGYCKVGRNVSQG